MRIMNRKAQAATELAVLGTLVIVAFSYLMLYSEKLNRQQAYLMQTFRTALAQAGGNGSASYSKIAHRRMANVVSPMTLGQSDTYSASASVLWGIGETESNLAEIDGTQVAGHEDTDDDGIPDSDEGDTTETTTSTVWASANLTKTQSPGGQIITTRSLEATDTISETDYGVTSYLGAGGKYSSGGGGLNRSRTWNTREN